MNPSLQTSLRQLRLSGMSTTLDVRLQEAGANRLTHEQFLELIVQDEMAVRADRRISRRVRRAAFVGLKALEDFDWRFNPSVIYGVGHQPARVFLAGNGIPIPGISAISNRQYLWSDFRDIWEKSNGDALVCARR